MRKAFTLVELLVVVAILAILSGILIVTFSRAPRKAEIAKCQELVKNVQVALTQVFDRDGIWPKALRKNSGSVTGLDAEAGYPLHAMLSLTAKNGRLSGLNTFGILTPWGEQVVKARGGACTESSEVPSVGGTIAEHRLRYALSLDGHGIIRNVDVAGTLPRAEIADAGPVDVRAIAAVWCRGPRGEFIRSWSDGDTEGVK